MDGWMELTLAMMVGLMNTVGTSRGVLNWDGYFQLSRLERYQS